MTLTHALANELAYIRALERFHQGVMNDHRQLIKDQPAIWRLADTVQETAAARFDGAPWTP